MAALALVLGLAAQGAPAVTGMSPLPGSTQASPPTVTITFGQNVDPATVSAATVTLVGRGPDGLFGTGDDVAVTPGSVTSSGNMVTLDLTGQTLADDVYRVRISGSPGVPAAAPGLFGHWRMDEGVGPTAADASGNLRHGTLNGAGWSSGLFGNAASFNGGATRVDIDAGIVTPNWTAALWVHRSGNVAGTAATLMDCPALTTGTSLRLEQVAASDQVGITEYTVVDYGFGYVAPLGTWVHLAFTSDGSNARLYVNGALQNTAPRAFNLHVDKLGSATTITTNSLIGLMDEVQVYSRVLTAGEISALATLTGGLRATGGEVLDGEFSGAFPSGNGAGGGDFVATFTVSAAGIAAIPAVTAMNPPPGGLQSSPAAVTITLSRNANPASVSAATVSLVGRGPDGLFGTGDDAAITPALITAVGNVITLDLAGQTLPDDVYRVRLSGSPTVPSAASGLFGHWRMNEGAGALVSDSSGNGRHGTMNGASWSTGLFGNALRLTGGGTRVDIDAGMIPPDWTVSLWACLTGNVGVAAATVLDANSSTGTSLQLEQIATGGDVGITEYTVVNYGFGYFAPLGTWVHLTFTSTSANARLYVNGALRDTAPRGFNLHLDKVGTARTFVSLSPICLLDEVQVYGRLLAASEIASLAVLLGGVRSDTEGVLDGEFSGTFPSGNGAGGGDFIAAFTVSATAPPVPILVDLAVGGCALLGPEILVPLALLLGLRRAAGRRRRSRSRLLLGRGPPYYRGLDS